MITTDNDWISKFVLEEMGDRGIGAPYLAGPGSVYFLQRVHYAYRTRPLSYLISTWQFTVFTRGETTGPE